MSERIERARSLLNAVDRDQAANATGLGTEGAARLVVGLLLSRSLPLDDWLPPSAREDLAAGRVHGYGQVDRRIVELLAASVVPPIEPEAGAGPTGHPWSAGTRVRVKTGVSRVGVVLTHQPMGNSFNYLVFTGTNAEAWYAAADLTRLQEAVEGVQLSHSQAVRLLGLTKLRHRFSDVLYSYRASRTRFQAYQFKPLLKYIDMESQGDARGLLIADEVGLGKTIEAAIILMEGRARSAMERVLVVCPAGLVLKWQAELWQRFDEDLQVFDRRSLTRWVDRYVDAGGVTPMAGVISLEALRDDDLREAIEAAMVHFDMVIVDEAHHLRNDQTKAHQVIESLANFTDRLILLTATPLQMHQEDLFNLLRLVAPEDFERLEDLEDRLVPNAFLNRAVSALSAYPPDLELARAELDRLARNPLGSAVVGNPGFMAARAQLDTGSASSATPDLVRVRRQLQALNTLAHVYTRTRKRDVMDAARRQATTIEVDLAPEEQSFYAAVLDWVRESLARRKQWGAVGFTLVSRERQAASCLPAAAEYFRELALDDAPDLGIEITDPGYSEEEATRPHLSAGDGMRLAATSLLASGVDSKYDRFLAALRGQLATDPDGKILVFSFFKRTLRYLQRRLHADGIAAIVVSGDTPPSERGRVLDRFRHGETRVLLSSEVGAEGLDLQFAYVLFNYDLPWNPMRVEQRIGRIDRYGQTSDRVLIFNLVLNDTVETRILTRLYDRINIFREAVGDLEPILGDVISFVTQRLFDHTLSPEEERRLAHEVERRIAEQEEDLHQFESRQAELMGNDQLFEGDVRERIESGRYISAVELHTIVDSWLVPRYPDARFAANGDGSFTLRGDPDLAAHLSAFTRRTTGTDAKGRAFAQRLQAEDLVSVTFDTDIAQERPAIELIHPRHALVQAAAAKADDDRVGGETVPPAHLAARTDLAPAGTWFFFVYRVEVNAAASSHTLESRVFSSTGQRDELVESRLLRLILEATDAPADPFRGAEFRDVQQLARRTAMGLRARRHEEEAERNAITLALRREAIQRAAAVKRRRAVDILERVADPRIRRMKEREVENIEAQLRHRLRDLQSRAQAVVSVSLVLEGQLTIQEP